MSRRLLWMVLVAVGLLIALDVGTPWIIRHLRPSAAYVEPGGPARVEGVITSALFVRQDSLAFRPPSERLLGGMLSHVQQLSGSAFGLLATESCFTVAF